MRKTFDSIQLQFDEEMGCYSECFIDQAEVGNKSQDKITTISYKMPNYGNTYVPLAIWQAAEYVWKPSISFFSLIESCSF